MIDKSLAISWLNIQVKAQKMRNKRLYEYGKDGRVTYMCSPDLQIASGIKLIADAAEIPYKEQPWDGNEQCGTNYIERSFVYRGFTFFELGTAEKFEEEDTINEETEIAD